MELKKRLSIQELKAYPAKKFPGKIHLIDTESAVSEAVEYLSRFKYLGFDTESKPVFEKGEVNENPIALMQFSTFNAAFLFRINKIGMPLELKFLLEDYRILKVGSAVKGDLDKIAQIDKEGSFYPNGFVEIQDIAAQFGIESVGLKKLTAILMDFRISKKFQLTNWELDLLTPGQISYAATDAWACYKIYEDFIRRGMVPKI